MDQKNQPIDLATRDYWILIDKSGSMGEPHPKASTRWKFAEEQTIAIARRCNEIDNDGIDVVLFSDRPKLYNNVTEAIVRNIFTENKPMGTTDTAAALKLVFETYFSKRNQGNAKPITIVCMTDGIPDSEAYVVKAIVDATKKIKSRNEISISFVQVGNDPAATKFLQRLDDNLTSEGAQFDIVDCRTEDQMAELSSYDQLLELSLTD